MRLPDISDNTYQTDPLLHKRFRDRGLFKGGFWFYPRYFFLVIWSGLRMIFASNPMKVVELQSLRTMRIVERQGVKLIFEGLNNFPAEEGPYVFACNHMSALEVNALPGLVASRTPMTFVAKDTLFRTPFFGRVLRGLNAIPVGRKHPGEDLRQVLTRGAELLEQGISILLFPEGTRHSSFSPARFNSLAVKLALRRGVKVVPVAVKTDFWGIGKLVRDVGPLRPDLPVRISFGEPVLPRGRGRAEQKLVTDYIAQCLLKWDGKVDVGEMLWKTGGKV